MSEQATSAGLPSHEAAAAAPVDNGQAPAAAGKRRTALPKPPSITPGPAAESGAAASYGPCAECAEREQGFEERLGRLEQAHAALAKLTVAAVVAAIAVYVLAGRAESKQE